jgi:hypothetical protein
MKKVFGWLKFALSYIDILRPWDDGEHTNRERETEFEEAREHMDLKPRL